MPMDVAQLTTDLEDLALGEYIFPGESVGRYPASIAEAASAWAAIYRAFAATTTAPSPPGTPVPASLSAAEATLASALALAFAVRPGAIPALASAISSAVTIFWLTPPVAFAGVSPGVVTAVGGTAALTSALSSAWTANATLFPQGGPSASTAAAQVGSALGAFTLTVLVTHAGPPVVGPLPLT